MISGNFRWLVASSTTEIISPGFLSSAPIVMWNAAFFLFLFFVTQDIRMNARKERILPLDEIEDLHDDDSDFLKSFEIKSKINIFFSQIHLILTVNNKTIIKTKKKTNNSIKTIISVMTAKKRKEKKVMEEKRPSLPEVVTVRKRPRTPGVTLNRLISIFSRRLCGIGVLLLPG